uniref:Uncharacterized protein n=1 Tax=Romanomermis culicivorax TaxID=13658 RepID=A0A915IBR4_ROMCU
MDWAKVEAMGGNNVVRVAVIDTADIEVIGGNNVVVLESDVETEVACSTSIGGTRGSRALNSGFGGFFKASRGF